MMLSPTQAWTRLNAQNITLMDTHGHAHLERRNDDSAYTVQEEGEDSINNILSLTCAVSPEDWVCCLAFAAQSTLRRAAIGVHPWYLDKLDESATWLQDLEALLQAHPKCLVGEIGLCKQAKFLRTFPGGKIEAVQIQQRVFVQQLQLATRYQRPVSIHCVNEQNYLLQTLKDHAANLPPTIALHSFTGTAHHVQQLLKWEATLVKRTSPLIYFGFSHSINYSMSSSEKSRRQTIQAICQVPTNRLLAESDVHSSRHVAAGTAGAVAYIAWALQSNATTGGSNNDNNNNNNKSIQVMSIETVAQWTTQNAMRFLNGGAQYS